MASEQQRRVQDKTKSNPSILSEGFEFTGNFSGISDVIVHGTIHGDCKVNSTVIIEKTGQWNGVIEAQHVIINGHIKGQVIAKGHLEIGSHAHIEGTVTAGSLAVATGAQIEGETRITGHATPIEFQERRK